MILRLGLFALVLATAVRAAERTLPLVPDSCRFAVIGDSGTGGEPQYRVAARMAEAHARFPFDLVIMLGDNIYGSDTAADMERKFARPYRPLLDAGVQFRAALGNHDDPSQRFYAPFHMGGERWYSFTCSHDSVRFFVLDSNYVGPDQLRWFGDALRSADEEWKIVYFHHPPYSTGTHGSAVELRATFEPFFLGYGVDVVFSGHEHFYERLRPQHGVQYFISGGAAKLRAGDVGFDGRLTAKAFDAGYHFMLVEIAADRLYFLAISDKGVTVDAGTIERRTARSAAGTH